MGNVLVFTYKSDLELMTNALFVYLRGYILVLLLVYFEKP